MSRENFQNVFIVVEVQAGVALGAQCYSDVTTAEKNAAELRSQHNVNDDDVQIFEAAIDLHE